jgi:exopolysaccharide biosynthesis WecB/TagA/CpsF family protein
LSLLTGSFDEAANWLVQKACDTKKTTMVTHINIYNYYYLRRNPDLNKKLNENCTSMLDGIGMKIGAFLLGLGWLPDLNGTDLFPLVMTRILKRPKRIFLLGAEKNIVMLAVRNIQKQFPEVKIVGYHTGYFKSKDETNIVSYINRKKAQILLVARGFGKQEEFVLKYCDQLKIPLIWNVGGLFDFISGVKPRAPLFLRRLRLEWLFRFLLEPGRMFFRNFIVAPWFIGYVVYKRILKSSLSFFKVLNA